MSRRNDKTLGRRAAIQVLYRYEILPASSGDTINIGFDEEMHYVPDEVGVNEYARMLVSGVLDNLEDIDARIMQASKNWELSRMQLVDKQLLRTTIYEMLFINEVPISVSINEAVELAKEYCGDDAHKFINGILGNIAREIDSQEQ